MNKVLCKRGDVWLIVGLLVVAIISLIIYNLSSKTGQVVVVTVNGEVVEEYSLGENITTEIITGNDGSQKNTLEINDGLVYIENANCPDKICVQHKPIKNSNETIVCLPHRVVVAVR